MSIMDRQKSTKLNHLLQMWPRGTVAPTMWLKEQGISRQLLARYEQYNWVKRLAKGCVVRAGEEVTWPGVVYSLQNLQELPVWIGSKTALEQRGLAHYANLRGRPSVELISAKVRRLPKWVFEIKTTAQFEFHLNVLFEKSHQQEGLTTLIVENLPLKISAPERAVMELLDQVPGHISFDEAQKIFEGLSTLRTPLVQKLLENCTSVKVKRLFLFFAENSGHSWFSKLVPKKIDLGKGKRAIVSSGRLNSKYQILIPSES
jgi:hypothetical protein